MTSILPDLILLIITGLYTGCRCVVGSAMLEGLPALIAVGATIFLDRVFCSLILREADVAIEDCGSESTEEDSTSDGNHSSSGDESDSPSSEEDGTSGAIYASSPDQSERRRTSTRPHPVRLAEYVGHYPHRCAAMSFTKKPLSRPPLPPYRDTPSCRSNKPISPPIIIHIRPSRPPIRLPPTAFSNASTSAPGPYSNYVLSLAKPAPPLTGLACLIPFPKIVPTLNWPLPPIPQHLRAALPELAPADMEVDHWGPLHTRGKIPAPPPVLAPPQNFFPRPYQSSPAAVRKFLTRFQSIDGVAAAGVDAACRLARTASTPSKYIQTKPPPVLELVPLLLLLGHSDDHPRTSRRASRAQTPPPRRASNHTPQLPDLVPVVLARRALCTQVRPSLTPPVPVSSIPSAHPIHSHFPALLPMPLSFAALILTPTCLGRRRAPIQSWVLIWRVLLHHQGVSARRGS
ncbi:hypothetical protein DFH09DRAFT_1333465 [Mycena vulgaris]|nr:hypothetical protein DFH09DRAFT_1333465 [Mycena vulgaris]